MHRALSRDCILIKRYLHYNFRSEINDLHGYILYITRAQTNAGFMRVAPKKWVTDSRSIIIIYTLASFNTTLSARLKEKNNKPRG